MKTPPARRPQPPPIPPPRGALHRYLRAEDTRALRDLEFHPRRLTHGMFAGRHASPQRGQSSEFSDYREFTPGDDLKHLDWKVLGRSDRLYIKTFEHQAQMNVHLLVDASASMAYGRSPIPATRRPGASTPPPDGGKYDFTCRIAAAIAFLVVRQQDRAGIGFARSGLLHHLPARGTMPHLFEMVARMEKTEPMGVSNLAESFTELVRRLRRRSVLIVLSDFMDDGDELLRALRMASHRGHTIALFHVLHPHELQLPDFGETLLTDSEDPRQRLRFHAPDVREAYQANLEAFLRRWHEGCLALGIDHQLAPCDRTVPDLLREFLTSHSRSR